MPHSKCKTLKRSIAVRFIVLALAFPFLSLIAPRLAAEQSAEKVTRRAEALLKKGKYEQSSDEFKKALNTDAKSMPARLGLCLALLKLGRFDLAYEQAGLSVSQDPLSARAHAMLGMSLLRLGDFAGSLEEFKAAIAADPREAFAIAGMSEINFYENRNKEAFEKIKLATFLQPDEPDFYMHLARAASRMEQYTTTAEAYERFLVVAPFTEVDKRDRIRGLIQFFKYFGNIKINRVSGERTTIVPFKLYKNRPYLPVMINGKGPFRFVVDSGAGISVLSLQAAKRLGLTPIAKGGRARAVGGSGSFPIIYGFVDSLKIGGAEINAVPVYFRAMPVDKESLDEITSEGYIGLSVLSQFLVTIDYAAEQMTLTRDNENDSTRKPAAQVAAAPDSEAANSIDLRSTSNGLLSTVTFLEDEHPLNFILDTGASLSVVSEALVHRLNWESKLLPNRTMRVLGAAGVIESAAVLYSPTMRIANLNKPNVVLPVLDFSPINETSGFEQMGILGGDFLRHFKVTFDFVRSQLTLTPQSNLITVDRGAQAGQLVR